MSTPPATSLRAQLKALKPSSDPSSIDVKTLVPERHLPEWIDEFQKGKRGRESRGVMAREQRLRGQQEAAGGREKGGGAVNELCAEELVRTEAYIPPSPLCQPTHSPTHPPQSTKHIVKNPTSHPSHSPVESNPSVTAK